MRMMSVTSGYAGKYVRVDNEIRRVFVRFGDHLWISSAADEDYTALVPLSEVEWPSDLELLLYLSEKGDEDE